MAVDLDRDITINGHRFAKGKGVDTKAVDYVDGKAVTNDYADAIKENLSRAKDYDAFASTHHGAVNYDGPKGFSANEAAEPNDTKGNKN